MNLQDSLFEVGITVFLILVGYLLGRFGRPKIYHGHLTAVPAKAKTPKDIHERMQGRVKKAFSHSRRPLREVNG